MCGITGIVAKSNCDNLSNLIKLQCDALTQRGPDAEGYYIDDTIALGHRRLSIIDLVSGDQPMYNVDRSVVIVFNGEIYNFKELRRELQTLGCTFVTESDTEVILHGYHIWGIHEILNRLEGMFAIALKDLGLDKFYLARDKFGEKPLYFLDNDDIFAFASELKGISHWLSQPTIEKKALNYFLALSYIPSPWTIYKGVYKLAPASYIEIDNERRIKVSKYYDLMERLDNLTSPSSFAEAKGQLRNLLHQSVAQRMIADVPLGSFLSGGIDSSIISSIMAELSPQPINTFSIGFKEKEYDESARAQLVADKLKSNHQVSFIGYEDVIDIIDNVIANFDEPFGDSSALPSYFVARLASQKVKVVLTGDCADELFGGYEKYLATYYLNEIKKYPRFAQSALKWLIYRIPHTRWTNSMLRRAKKVLMGLDEKPFDVHFKMMCLGFNDEDRVCLLTKDQYSEVRTDIEDTFNSIEGSDLLKGFYTDLKYVLEGDMLVKVDRVCMQNSLEARVPFLDSKIVEFAFSIPDDYKIKGRSKKHILKETFKDILPNETVGFRKKGFGVPVDYWFKNELKDEMETLMSPSFIANQGIFSSDYLQKLWHEHQSGKENHKGKLWNIYVFQKWYKKNFTDKTI